MVPFSPWRSEEPLHQVSHLTLTDRAARLGRAGLLETREGGRRSGDRLHDLRHTHASQLLMAGINVKVVSERLGHASVSFTLDTYAHVMPGQQAEAAAAAALLSKP